MELLNKIFDIQLHAETQVTTQPSLSVEMKTYYHDKLIDNAEPMLVHDQFGSKYPIPRGKGKTIEFRRYAPLKKALNPLTEGVTPKGNALSVSNIVATVAQYGDYIEISDLLDLTAIDRNLDEATILLGAQAGRTLDTITREILAGGTSKLFQPAVAGGNETPVLMRADVKAATCTLTPKTIKKAVTILKRQNAAPFEDGSYVMIVHPDVAGDLMGDPNWIDIHKYKNPENIYNGEIGKLYGVRFVETTEAKIIGPGVISGEFERLTVKTQASSGATSIVVNEEVEMPEGVSSISVYINGTANTITNIVKGNGQSTLTVSATAAAVPAGSIVCGAQAGRDGSAIYCSLLIARNAYGVTSLEGGGLEHFIKQLGSAGSADPLNQRATTGWKATKTAEILVQEYMLRIEHSSAEFGMTATSN